MKKETQNAIAYAGIGAVIGMVWAYIIPAIFLLGILAIFLGFIGYTAAENIFPRGLAYALMGYGFGELVGLYLPWYFITIITIGVLYIGLKKYDEPKKTNRGVSSAGCQRA